MLQLRDIMLKNNTLTNSKKQLELYQLELKTKHSQLQKQFNKLNEDSSTNHNIPKIILKSKAVIDANKLQYIKSDGHYLEFYIDGKDKPEIDRNSLINILETLTAQQFVRIHKSYIVNVFHIKIINSTKLMLKNGKWINLSRKYKQQLKDILHIK